MNMPSVVIGLFVHLKLVSFQVYGNRTNIFATAGSIVGTDIFVITCRITSSCSWISGTPWKWGCHSLVFVPGNKLQWGK